jgi:hypothetical protein
MVSPLVDQIPSNILDVFHGPTGIIFEVVHVYEDPAVLALLGDQSSPCAGSPLPILP